MYVRNGANNAWQEVTSVGDFKYLYLCPTSGSGAPSFPGASYDLRETSNTGTSASVTSAAQLLVSVNGVIQQANTGTSTSGLDGFVMEDANSIKFAANLVATDDVFIIQIGSAVTLNAPANNTVATDTLQSQAVTEAKMLISNAPSDGKYLQYKDSSDKLTWADVPAGVGGATGVTFNDSVLVKFGTDTDYDISCDGTNLILDHTTDGQRTLIRSKQNGSIQFDASDTGNQVAAIFKWSNDSTPVSSAELYFGGVKKAETVTGGFTITGVCTATSYAGDGSNLTGVASATADGCLYENSQSITNNYTIASGKGAHSVGPLAISATLTINGTLVVS